MKNQEKHFPRSRNTGGARQAAQPAKPASQKSRKLRNQRKTNEKSRKTSPQIKKMPAIQPNQPNQPAKNQENQEIKEQTMKICCSSQIGSSQIGWSPSARFWYFYVFFLAISAFSEFSAFFVDPAAGWLAQVSGQVQFRGSSQFGSSQIGLSQIGSSQIGSGLADWAACLAPPVLLGWFGGLGCLPCTPSIS